MAAIADPVRLHIIRRLCEKGAATAGELAIRGQSSNQTLRRHLQALVAIGVILEIPGQSDGATPGRPAARFAIRTDLQQSMRTVLAGLGRVGGEVRRP